ncbi:hypothetical protein [Thiocapsa rosea]|uniref:Uncharacterized protein n=1 Tax=Thiocapsa rosea TaxID=69360 RepID=A0A495V922_9GAMM|nr:hypothetical protein [Thiocapsa rosea]RKT44867.1 hypothetical protein BDD21_2271 [Thiocapsa rosea]
MHDLDRVRLESGADFEQWAEPPADNGASALQAEAFEFEASEEPFAAAGEMVFDEAQEMELAGELLATTSDAELDQFLGALIGRAGQVIGQAVRSPTAQALGGYLKGAARQALPAVGGWVGDQLGSAAGSWAGGRVGSAAGGLAGSRLGGVPGGAAGRIAGGAAGRYVGGRAGSAAGRWLGTQAGTAAGRLFGLELEGLSGEDQEFEVARHFVRFAGAAVRNAATAPASPNPVAAARAAAIAAAERHAPGLLRPTAPRRPGPAVAPAIGTSSALGLAGRAQSGRWMRRGNKIVVLGL